jgi:hypothetical protein
VARKPRDGPAVEEPVADGPIEEPAELVDRDEPVLLGLEEVRETIDVHANPSSRSIAYHPFRWRW